MAFSYLSKQKLDELDLETFSEGDAIHIRRKSTQEGFDLAEEKRMFMELYEKHGIEMRAQFQHDGFWGTGLRNDFDADGKAGRWNYSLPQGISDYKSSGWKTPDDAPETDPWPRMYTKAWLVGN